MATGAARFRLDGVTIAFGRMVALDAVDLEIAPGEAVALVGPSGAGKTTLLRLLNGTIRPTRGTVAVDGVRLADLPLGEIRRVRAAIGFIHQDLSLVPNQRVLHNVLAGKLGSQSLLGALRCHLLPPRAAVLAVHEILERVGIADKLYQPTRRLSGGEQQRVAIARALYQEPEALLADEPVSSVDPARARDTVGLLCEISRERGLTLCMSLHDVRLALELFPRLIGIRGGRIVFDRRGEGVAEAELEALYDLAPDEAPCS